MLNGNIDLTPLFNIIISLIVLIWTYKLLPLLKSKLTDSEFKRLKAVSETAVYAAEKIYGAGHGDEKLDYAIKEIEKKGFTADRAVIEEFVMKLSLATDWWGENDVIIEDDEDRLEDEGIEEVEHDTVKEFHTDTINDEE